MLTNVPDICPHDIQRRLVMGDKIYISNRCCVFEDFYVNPFFGIYFWNICPIYMQFLCGKRMSLEALFGKEQERNGQIYSIHSYLQSWKYLHLAKNWAEVHLNPHFISSARKYLKNIAPDHKRVALHLRVADASGPQHIYNFPGPEYFRKAMQYFLEKWGRVKFLVFSDNTTWCKKQSLFDSENIYIMDVVLKNDTSVKNDMGLMSACDGVILSVGTFGWWAGYFSSQHGGEVVYFKNNFNSTQVRAMGEVVVEEDYFPQTWNGIVAPALDRQGKLVQDMKGDVLSK